MKKLIVIGIVMVMALSATAAMAAIDNDWLVYFKASTDSLAKSGASNGTLGLKTAANDSFANYSTVATLSTYPEINYTDSGHPYTTSYGNIPGRTYVAKFGGAPLGPDPKKTVIDWAFKVAGNGGATVYLTAWNQTGTTTQIDAGTTQLIELWAGNSSGEKVGTAPIWMFNPGQQASWTSGGGIVGTANDQNATNGYFSQSYVLGNNDSAGGAYKYFVLEATTVPEPGSLVALFSGIIGLVGFGIRRRK
jgi:hypothetical protein